MERSQRSSRGVLGPVGLFLVAVLWLMTMSGNVPSKNLAAPAPAPKSDFALEGIVHVPTTQEVLTTHPATLPAASRRV